MEFITVYKILLVILGILVIANIAKHGFNKWLYGDAAELEKLLIFDKDFPDSVDKMSEALGKKIQELEEAEIRLWKKTIEKHPAKIGECPEHIFKKLYPEKLVDLKRIGIFD